MSDKIRLGEGSISFPGLSVTVHRYVGLRRHEDGTATVLFQRPGEPLMELARLTKADVAALLRALRQAG